MDKIKKLISARVPLEGKEIFLDNIGLNDLIKVKMCANKEGFEKFTCRPVHKISNEERIERYKKLLEVKSTCILGVYHKVEKNILGHISIFDYNPRSRALEMGYYLVEEYRCNGYMKEAVELLNKFLFEEVKINKIMAQTGSFNEGSNALLKSCGFNLDGCLREHHELDGTLYDDNLYSLLKRESNTLK